MKMQEFVAATLCEKHPEKRERKEISTVVEYFIAKYMIQMYVCVHI